MVVNRHVGAGKQTQVFCKSRKCSQLLAIFPAPGEVPYLCQVRLDRHYSNYTQIIKCHDCLIFVVHFLGYKGLFTYMASRGVIQSRGYIYRSLCCIDLDASLVCSLTNQALEQDSEFLFLHFKWEKKQDIHHGAIMRTQGKCVHGFQHNA